MPNLIRQNRGHHPPPIQYPILRDPGTQLSHRERDIAYSLNRYTGWAHRRISSSLGISTQGIPR